MSDTALCVLLIIFVSTLHTLSASLHVLAQLLYCMTSIARKDLFAKSSKRNETFLREGKSPKKSTRNAPLAGPNSAELACVRVVAILFFGKLHYHSIFPQGCSTITFLKLNLSTTRSGLHFSCERVSATVDFIRGALMKAGALCLSKVRREQHVASLEGLQNRQSE